MKLLSVVLSTYVGAGGCGCFISISVCHAAVASWLLSKADYISYSEAEVTMLFNILHSVWMDPFGFGFGCALSMSLMKSLRN